MKPSLKSIRLLLLLVAVTMGSIDVFAQDVAPTPWREWDFNNVAFAFGRYADEGSTINSDAAKEDWQRNDIDVQIEEAYWNANDELEYHTINKTSAHAFCKHEIRNHQIQGGQRLYLNAGWPLFGELMNNIVFNAPEGAFGFCNEAATSTPGVDVQERYIALKYGASFTLTDLQEGDWVVIKMDRNVGTANLKITGAKDALGNNINSNDEYGIGGCQWFNNGNATNKDYHWRGEYHFQATGNQMTFYYNGGVTDQMLKLYNIKLYRNANVYPSENSIVCSKHYGQTFYYYKDDTNSGADKTGHYELHYRGKAEITHLISVAKSGTLSFTESNFTKSGDYKYLLKSNAGEWGIFKVRLASKEHHGKYYTDYADRICSQTYLNKVDYPCTWDFTDLQTYFDNGDAWKENPNISQSPIYGHPELAFWTLDGDFYGEHKYCFQMGVNKIGEGAGHNAQYVNGGELHLGDHAFPELKGLGVSAYNWGGHLYNDMLQVTSEGIAIDAVVDGEGRPFKFHIPEIGGTSGEPAAVYVRVKKIDDTYVCFNYQKGSAAAAQMEFVGIDPETSELVYRTPQITSNDNVVLWLNGCVVKKIAVTKDFKSVNSYGYSTESRTRAIDHNLTPYFTAGKVKAYSVSNVDYDNSKIVLAQVDKILPAASANGEEGLGVILYNNEETSFDFGLFVADIHDTETLRGTNMLCANLIQNNSIGANPGKYTNYLLNAKGTNPVNGKTVEGIAFYRASKKATLGPNKAYLPILTSAVQPSTGNLGGAKMQIVFVDADDAEDDATVTAVKEIEVSNAAEENTYYTLSGIKIGRPTKSGIYIKNGKKIIIK